ncbi:MAG: hypothetical protein R3A44_44610 [Caldilineaceae bacterium]
MASGGGRFAEAHVAYQTALALAETLEGRSARRLHYLSILHRQQSRISTPPCGTPTASSISMSAYDRLTRI